MYKVILNYRHSLLRGKPEKTTLLKSFPKEEFANALLFASEYKRPPEDTNITLEEYSEDGKLLRRWYIPPFDLINTATDGLHLFEVTFNIGINGCGGSLYLFDENSDDAIDHAFEWAAENKPSLLDDEEAVEFIAGLRKKGIEDEDTLSEELDDMYYSACGHYVFRDDFGINEITPEEFE